MPVPLKRQRRVSLRQCALHNSYYANELINSRHKVARLTERIKELEKEKVRYREQVVNANKQVVNANKQVVKANKRAAAAANAAAEEAARADGILQFGFEEETIKADIKKLRNERAILNHRVIGLQEVIIKIKHRIRQIRIQDTNHQIRKLN
jgi:chromosome segregation ATPase